VCKLAFERMADQPDTLYGEDVGSSYQGQQTMLSKHFVDHSTSAASTRASVLERPLQLPT